MSERITGSLDRFRSLPKVELHRHLEGSLRLGTLLDVARTHNIPIPEDVLGLSSLVQMQEDENFSFRNFLSKFDTLRLFYRSPEVISRITREAVRGRSPGQRALHGTAFHARSAQPCRAFSSQ